MTERKILAGILADKDNLSFKSYLEEADYLIANGVVALLKCAPAADVVEVPSHNINDLQTAVKGLGIFRLSWCVKEWDGDEPSFHCSECPFEDKETRKCSVKIFLREHATREERDRFSPIV